MSFILLILISLPLISSSPSPTPAYSPVHAPGPTHAPTSLTSTSTSTTPPGVNLITETCEFTNHKDYCIKYLTSEPLAHKAQPKQLAAIALRLAHQNGTETFGYIMGLLDETEAEPNTQQCLTDCNEDYELALGELDDALAALDDNLFDANAYLDAIKWIQTAMDHVKTCQEGCKEGAEHKNVMTKRNGAFNKFCSIAISIIKSLPSLD